MNLKTSAIRHPTENPFVVRREWAIKAMLTFYPSKKKREESVACSAELLSIFEEHYNNPLQNRLFVNLINKAVKKEKDYLETDHWLPYSTAYLGECLLNTRGRDVINRSLIMLTEIGFIDDGVSTEITKWYASGTLNWYRLNTANVNQWINTTYHRNDLVIMTFSEMPEELAELDALEHTAGLVDKVVSNYQTAGVEFLEDAVPDTSAFLTDENQDYFTETILDYVTAQIKGSPKKVTVDAQINKVAETICEFYRHIHNKNKKFIFDRLRRKAVVERIREGRSFAQFSQAIIGNVFSDYHQGRDTEKNPSGKIYDDIELICRSAAHFERHIHYALKAKVTEEIASQQFKKWLDNQTSDYAKTQVFSKQTLPTEKIQSKYAPQEVQACKQFVDAIAPFFAVNVPLPTSEVIEMCKNDKTLYRLGQSVTDSGLLRTLLSKVVIIFKKDVTEEVQKAIEEFSLEWIKVE